MKKLRNLKHILIVSLLSLTLIFGSIMIFSAEFSSSINGFFVYRTTGGVWQDKIYTHHLAPSPDIVIIKIDERTLNTLQSKSNLKMLTIPKSTYSDLISKLEGAGVKGIGFDILFQNGDPEEQIFANTMAKYDNIVIASQYIEDMCVQKYGVIWNNLGEDQKHIFTKVPKQSTCDVELFQILKALPSNTKIPPNLHIVIEKKGENLTDADKISTYCETDLNEVIDCPGLPRSIYNRTPWGLIDINSSFARPLSIDIDTQAYKIWKTGIGNNIKRSELEQNTLPFALYRTTNTGTISSLQSFLSKPTSLYANKPIPTVLQPYFRGTADTINSYKTISLIDVIDMSRVDLITNFAGKYIFLGVSSTAVNDSKVSPVTGDNMDGVELHAHFLDGLLQNKMLAHLDSNTSFAAVIGLTIVMIILYLLLPSYLSPILAIVMMVGILWVSRYLYDIERTLVDTFPLFLAGGLLTFPLTFIYRFFVVDRERRYIENAFGHYIDPKMVKMINMEEVELTLGGEQRDVTVFFSDIAGFTTISEALGTRDLFYLMSSYLSRMTDILIREGGTLDKYIGDAVMGFFGAPVTQADHARRACRTALEMRKILPEFNREITERGVAPIEFRVGIASGEVMVGNIGSSDHFNYTVLGDTVNLASRLEAMGKEYGVHVIISGGTYDQVGDIFAVRELDTIAVKGKTEGIHIYELLGLLGYTTDSQIHETYAHALLLYRTDQYMAAAELWESQMESDPPSRVMAHRCYDIIEGRIHIVDGVYHMDHK